MPNRTFGASPTHPAKNQLSLLVNNRFRTALRRGRAFDTHNRSYGKRLSLGGKFSGLGVDLSRHTIKYDRPLVPAVQLIERRAGCARRATATCAGCGKV